MLKECIVSINGKLIYRARGKELRELAGYVQSDNTRALLMFARLHYNSFVPDEYINFAFAGTSPKGPIYRDVVRIISYHICETGVDRVETYRPLQAVTYSILGGQQFHDVAAWLPDKGGFSRVSD